jgi:hypothetical protein
MYDETEEGRREGGREGERPKHDHIHDLPAST